MDQNVAHIARLAIRMAAFLFRCPNTGLNVQGWLAEIVETEDADRYELVTCLACGQGHVVNTKTGKTLGVDDE